MDKESYICAMKSYFEIHYYAFLFGTSLNLLLLLNLTPIQLELFITSERIKIVIIEKEKESVIKSLVFGFQH